MQDFEFLADRFFEHFGQPQAGISGHLEPSANSAVGQFRNHQNSVGFLPVYTCPGATWGEGGCGSVCYARHGRGQMPGTMRRLVRNTGVLIEFCQQGDVEGLTQEFLFLLDLSVRQFDTRLTREARLPPRKIRRALEVRGPIFRFNWAGDLLHPVQARAVVQACRQRPRVACWLYTRSFHLLKILEPIPENLTVWLSVDAQNRVDALRAHRRHPWSKLAYMGEEAKGIICPKYRYLPTARACARCGICFTGTARAVVFPIRKFISGEKPNPFGEILQIQKAS